MEMIKELNYQHAGTPLLYLTIPPTKTNCPLEEPGALFCCPVQVFSPQVDGHGTLCGALVP